VSEIDRVVYPYLPWEDESRLFGEALAAERAFLSEAETAPTAELLRIARDRVPVRSGNIPGLLEPNESLQKGRLKKLAYRLLVHDSLVSRNVAERQSSEIEREQVTYHRQWQEELETALDELQLRPRLTRVEHHQSHASNAYYTGGFEDALVLTLDGYGSGLSTTVSEGRQGRLRRLHEVRYPHSLGMFFESATAGLGYHPGRDDAKVLGLSAYGDPEVLRDVLLARVQLLEGDYRFLGSNNIYFARLLAGDFPRIDVAAAYQDVLERVATTYVGHYVRTTGLSNLVISGGVAVNVRLNQRLRQIPGVERIYVYPNMGDAGCAVGAGLLQYATDGRAPSEPLRHVFWGPSFSDEDIGAALRRAQLSFDEYPDIELKIAALLASGRVVARFDGRMEYGPRALGNRSILYHAREPEANQWLNQRLGRTEFMPFSPATLFEECHRCYLDVAGAEHAAQFMTISFDCTEAMKRESPAAVHVDGTARPQLVTSDSSPGLHKILYEYCRLTGLPTLINTSFSIHGEPIVCEPEAAVRVFLQGNLDYLAIGRFLVAHPTARR
jgi:carbamoyltransferase